MPGPAASLRLGRYQRSWLRWDLLAGVTTAAVVVPRVVAYASLAGLPVQVGLYVATVPMVVYALGGHRGQPAGQGAVTKRMLALGYGDGMGTTDADQDALARS